MSETTMSAPAARPFGLGWLRTAGTLLLFLLSVVAGAYAQRLTVPAATPYEYAPLPRVNEPPEGRQILAVIMANDARTLASMVDGETLQALGEAMKPVDDLLDAQFVGAVERNGETLAAYTIVGRQGGQGEKIPVGVVFHITAGRIVGVN